MAPILDALNHLQAEHGHLRDDDLRALSVKLGEPLYKLEGLVSFYPHFRRTPPARVEVALCRDVACRLAGGKRWAEDARRKLEAMPGVSVREASCLGRCDAAPALTVNEHPMSHGDTEALRRALEAPPDPHAEQRSPAPPRAWATDPYSSVEARYGALRRALAAERDGDGDASDIVTVLKESGLRGMGGAGFPTGKKWELVRAEPASPKYVVCNADESEPGTFKDRVILDELPHLVLEGIALAGLTVGAAQGIVFLRHEYAAEKTSLARAIEEARARGVLGPDAFGPGKPFDIQIFVSPGGYILGEETALLECLEDRRGEPRNKPPYPGREGLFGKPTLINNVETLSLVPVILERGAEAWKALGARGAVGLKFISISGDVVSPGVYLVPMGTTVGELVAQAGGVTGGRGVLAVAPGGASSNFLRGAEALEAPLDFAALEKRGSMLGSGAVLVVAEGADILDLAANVVAFFRNESCGKCVPCRVGSEKAVAMLERALEGRGSRRHLELLPELSDTLAKTSICGLGQVALAPFLSVLAAFEGEVRARFPEE